MKRWALVFGSIFLVGLWAGTMLAQGDSHAAGSQDASKQASSYSVRTLALPDSDKGDVPMDYIGYDPSTNSVWVPGGLTGAVYVVDAATGKVRQVSAPTAEVDFRGG